MATLNEKMQEALNEQINAELYSAYLYLAMAAYFDSANRHGMAQWMKAQFQEERKHAMRLYEHVNERGGRVRLRAIQAPPMEWASPLAAFQAAYQHEQKVTGLINELVRLARQEGDGEAEAHLQWFVREQEEEEESADGVVQKLKRAEGSAQELERLDRELGQRQA